MAIKKYNSLQFGDTIGIVTPSWPGNIHLKEKFENGMLNLKKSGFEVITGSVTSSGWNENYRTTTAENRADEINQMITDPRVHAIMCTIGGNVSGSLLEFIDWERLVASGKLFTGYSDITALHCGFLKHGLRSLYGPALIPSFGEYPEPFPYTLKQFLIQAGVTKVALPYRHVMPDKYSNHFIDARKPDWKTTTRQYHDNEGWNSLNHGICEGDLVAFNQNTLLTLAGTPYFPETAGKILLLENMNSSLEQEERQLNQLKMMGVFEGIKGLIFSKFEKIDLSSEVVTHAQLIREFVRPKPGIPVVVNFDCGHTHPMLCLPQMTRFRLISSEKGVELWQMEMPF